MLSGCVGDLHSAGCCCCCGGPWVWCVCSRLQGQLIFLMGGDKSLADDVAPQLSLMGKAAHFLGDTGKGSEMKLVVNMVSA